MLQAPNVKVNAVCGHFCYGASHTFFPVFMYNFTVVLIVYTVAPNEHFFSLYTQYCIWRE